MIQNAQYMDNNLPYLSCPYHRNFHTHTVSDNTTWQTLTNREHHWIVLRASQQNAKPDHNVTMYQPQTPEHEPAWTFITYEDLDASDYTLEEITTQDVLDTYFTTPDQVKENVTYLTALFKVAYTDVEWETELDEVLTEKNRNDTDYLNLRDELTTLSPQQADDIVESIRVTHK